MGSSSGNNREATELQRRSLALQEEQAAANLAFLDTQTKALKRNGSPTYKPSMPPPTASTSGMDAAAAAERLAASRRFGYNDTLRGGLARAR